MSYSIPTANMVLHQILANRLEATMDAPTTHLLHAFSTIPREKFLPKPLAGVAYADMCLALGNGRYVMRPMLLAQMIQALHLQANDTVLDLHCGNGYSTAILAKMSHQVVGIETDTMLAEQAKQHLSALHLNRATILNHFPSKHESNHPQNFSAILIQGVIDELPAKLIQRLTNHGKIVAVIADKQAPRINPHTVFGEVTLFQKIGSVMSPTPLFSCYLYPSPPIQEVD